MPDGVRSQTDVGTIPESYRAGIDVEVFEDALPERDVAGWCSRNGCGAFGGFHAYHIDEGLVSIDDFPYHGLCYPFRYFKVLNGDDSRIGVHGSVAYRTGEHDLEISHITSLLGTEHGDATTQNA